MPGPRFNPRAREGATAGSTIAIRSGSRFNPRAREGATSEPNLCIFDTDCFNPRAREGATVRITMVNGSNIVSIHAPVRARPLYCRRLD